MWFVDYSYNCWFNPLATDDAFWHCLTLVVCYQLAQYVLKIGFALARKYLGQGRQVGIAMTCCVHYGCLGWL